jgi:F-type H+-transporting ATPase subunit gamma
MANLRDIKRRIGSVVNTQKITRAMKLVAAAKFARASNAVNAARPYSKALDEMVTRLVASGGADIESPLLRQSEEKKSLVVVLATDRGLCGGLNSNQFKFLRNWLPVKRQEGVSIELLSLGRKAISWGKKQNLPIVKEQEKLLDKPDYIRARMLVDELIVKFEQYDRIYFCYNQFQSAMAQTPVVEQLLPVALATSITEGGSKTTAVSGSNFSSEPATNFIIEPSLGEMIDLLLMRKLTSKVFQGMLEGAASEQGSRMTAMDSATNNAGEVRKKLTLDYNRARQAAITNELIEIISGAEAL